MIIEHFQLKNIYPCTKISVSILNDRDLIHDYSCIEALIADCGGIWYGWECRDAIYFLHFNSLILFWQKELTLQVTIVLVNNTFSLWWKRWWQRTLCYQVLNDHNNGKHIQPIQHRPCLSIATILIPVLTHNTYLKGWYCRWGLRVCFLWVGSLRCLVSALLLASGSSGCEE